MKAVLILAVALGGWGANAQNRKELTVCVADWAKQEDGLRQSWRMELSRILAVTGHSLRLECEPGAVGVRFLRSHAEEPSALGSVRTSGSRVLPRIELYVSPVAELIGTRLEGPLGIALARVSAHELAHLMSQQSRHAHGGASGAYYTAGMLLAASSRHFRLPVAAAD